MSNQNEYWNAMPRQSSMTRQPLTPLSTNLLGNYLPQIAMLTPEQLAQHNQRTRSSCVQSSPPFVNLFSTPVNSSNFNSQAPNLPPDQYWQLVCSLAREKDQCKEDLQRLKSELSALKAARTTEATSQGRKPKQWKSLGDNASKEAMEKQVNRATADIMKFCQERWPDAQGGTMYSALSRDAFARVLRRCPDEEWVRQVAEKVRMPPHILKTRTRGSGCATSLVVTLDT